MSTNENTPLPDEISKDRAMAVRRAAPAEQQDTGWSVPAMWTEAAQPASLNLSLYLHGLRRHWVMATAIGLCCALAGGAVVWFGYGKRYTATAQLRVASSEQPLVTSIVGTRASNQRLYTIYQNTQLQLVQSPFVLRAALRKEKVSNLKCIKRENDPVAWLEKELQVGFPGESEIMVVAMTGKDPKEVTTVVDEVVKAYMNEVVDKEQIVGRARLKKLEDIEASTQAQVRKKLGELKEQAESLGTSYKENFSVKEKHALQQYADYRSQQVKTEFALRQFQGELMTEEELLKGLDAVEISEYEVDAAAKNDPMIRQLESQLSFQQWDAEFTSTTAANSKSRYAERFRQEYDLTFRQLEERRQGLREQIRGIKRAESEEKIRALKIQVAVYELQLTKITEDLKKQDELVGRIGKTSIDVEMMRGDLDTLNAVLNNITKEKEALNVELQAAPRIEILQPPFIPETPANMPILVTLMVLAGVGGICIPMVGIVWWDTRAKRINTSAEVSKNLGLTVLGSVPMIPARVIRQLGSPSKRNQSWHMRLTESVDGIAARLLRKAALNHTRVILVSSAVGSEGKTTLATQLAMSLARNGRDTVLVDFDLRRPAFNEVFGVPLEPGVSEALRREVDYGQLVHPTGTDNLSVVTAGRWDRHALAALANGAVGPMFEKLRAEHEFIVVDASPILPVADTRFVSQHVDTVVLSVFRDVSQAPKVEAACEILEAFGVDSIEAVVTGSSESLRDRDVGYEPRLSA